MNNHGAQIGRREMSESQNIRAKRKNSQFETVNYRRGN